MKKFILKEILSKDIPTRFTLSCLKLVYITACLVLLYCLFLKGTQGFGYIEKIMMKEMLLYVGTSAGLSLSFGLLLSIYLKRNEK